MNIKTILYTLILPIVIWIISSIRIEKIFKKNHTSQIIMFYIFISISLSYLVVNFIYDVYEVSIIHY
jgi:uncharacterized integral membrane protein (TIGR02327 family)